MPVKILLIDDDPQLRQLLGDRLQASGYQVSFAANGREGVEEVQQEKPEIVLLDLEMPEMNGMAVLSEIRRCHAALPVILLTAHGTTEKAVEARRRGANAFLAKSSAMPQLLLLIQELLMNRAAE